MRRHLTVSIFQTIFVGFILPAVAGAQGPPPSPVRTTEARSQSIRGSVQLPGTVDAHTLSRVASEVDGVVASRVVREGERVKKGAPLITLRTQSLELRLAAARGELKEAAARLERAERELTRRRDLFAKDLVSEGEIDDAQSDFSAWEGRVEQLGADIRGIELDLERCTIRAPFSGVVVEEHVDVGEWVGVGAPVMELLSLDDLEALVEVPDRYFGMVHHGDAATLTVDTTPPLVMDGKVTAIIPRADQRARTFPIKVSIPDREGRVAVGMMVQVTLPVGENASSLLVPKDAVVTQGAGRFVYRVADDDTVVLVPVTVGSGAGDWFAVTGELEAGQRVVTRGNERLRPGQKVAAQPMEYELP
jgi:RND family efflux transporter MFP subunit